MYKYDKRSERNYGHDLEKFSLGGPAALTPAYRQIFSFHRRVYKLFRIISYTARIEDDEKP